MTVEKQTKISTDDGIELDVVEHDVDLSEDPVEKPGEDDNDEDTQED